MENNNNNGRGIFYGVIGVATLVVAVIGATFAYFAAQVSSNENDITAASSQVQNFTLTQVITGLKSNLIPVDSELAGFKTAAGITADKCKDTNGNNFCSVWSFTVTNPNAQAQQAYFYFEPSQNTFTNLHYAVFKGTPTSYDVTATAATPANTTTAARQVADGSIVISDTQLTLNDTARKTWSNLTQVIPAGETATYTIILWIEETNTDQSSIDSGKAFAAGVRIATGQVNEAGEITGGGVTAVLSTT